MAYKTLYERDRDENPDIYYQERDKANAAGITPYTWSEFMQTYGDVYNANGGGTYTTANQVNAPSNVVNADYSILNSTGVQAVLQQNKDTWSNLNNQYKQLLNAGDAAGAAAAKAERDAVHADQERIRGMAGYVGGTDGSQYITGVNFNTPKEEENQGIFRLYDQYYDNPYGIAGNTGYSSGYASTLDGLVNGILNREAFSYNKDTDPLYQQYADSYTRGGQRAMQDVLAQISARTGGIASSYATGASQQTFNNYMAQLADKVPELYQIRYNEYLNELEQQRADVDMVLGIDNTYYDRYRDTVADQQWQQSFDYNAAVDDRNYNYNANADQRALAQSQVDAILSAGGTPSAQLLQQAGYSSEYAAALQSYYAQQNAPRYVPEEQPAPIVQDEKGPTRPEEWYTDENYVATVKRMLDRQGEYEQMVDLLDTLATEGRLNENQLNELLDYIGVKK